MSDTKNKTLKAKGKGKELDSIVNDIIDICNDTIVKYKTEKALKPSAHVGIREDITRWNIIIDNIPTIMDVECIVRSSSDYYMLILKRDLIWDGNVLMEKRKCNQDFFDIEVKKDVINKNDITKKIIDLFSINDLSFCKCKNTFTRKNIFYKTANYFDIKLRNVEECCVCYDKTRTHTENCKHYICLECAPKLKTFCRYDGDNIPYFKCPMCRENTDELVDAVDLRDCLSEEED